MQFRKAIDLKQLSKKYLDLCRNNQDPVKDMK